MQSKTKKTKAKSRSKVITKKKDYVIVSSKIYGNKLKGIKVYFEGKKPKSLKPDGSIGFGKNILELFKISFEKFKWILTEDINEIKFTYGSHKIRTSLKTLQKMHSQTYERTRDVKEDIIRKTFGDIYPEFFKSRLSHKYLPGTIAKVLSENILKDLSSDDKDALNSFLPDFIAKESVSAVNILKATTQIKTLKELAEEIKTEISGNRSESWWQQYIHKNILIIQQGYIQAIEKMNISIGKTKFPDYTLVTHDGFLDILEIKKPTTILIKEDKSRSNFHWDIEITKAIIQVENYIENVSKHADSVRSFIKDEYRIEQKVVRPRGIILAGESGKFSSQKEKDDFRLLTQASKNISFVTYDELVTRLENYIKVLEKHSSPKE